MVFGRDVERMLEGRDRERLLPIAERLGIAHYELMTRDQLLRTILEERPGAVRRAAGSGPGWGAFCLAVAVVMLGLLAAAALAAALGADDSSIGNDPIVSLLEEELHLRNVRIDFVQGRVGSFEYAQPSKRARTLAKHVPDRRRSYEDGLVLLAAQRYGETKAKFERHIENAPEDRLKCLRALAVASRMEGDSASAVEASKRAVELAPQNPVLQSEAGYAAYAAGDYEGATVFFRRAVETLEASAYPGDRVAALNNLAAALQMELEFGEAEAFLEKAVLVASESRMSEHLVDELEELLGGLDRTRGDHAAALKHYRRAMEQAEARSSNALDFQFRRARLLQFEGRFADAVPAYEEGLEELVRRTGETHPNYPLHLREFGEMLEQLGQYGRAEGAYRKSLELTGQSVGRRHPEYAQTELRLAGCLRAVSRHPESEPLYADAFGILRQALGPAHPTYLLTLCEFGEFNLRVGRLGAAAQAYQEAISGFRESVGEEHPLYTSAVSGLASLYRMLARLDDAEPLMLEVAETDRRRLGEQHLLYGHDLFRLGGLYHARGRYAESLGTLERALEIFEGASGAAHPTVSIVRAQLGRVQGTAGNYPEAQKLYQEAITGTVGMLGEQHVNVAAFANGLGVVLYEKGDPAGALEQFEAALNILRSVIGARHMEYGKVLGNAATANLELGRLELAEEQVREGIATVSSIGGEFPHFVLAFLRNLAGSVYSTRGDRRAEEEFRQALELAERLLGAEHLDTSVVLRDYGRYLSGRDKPRSDSLLARAAKIENDYAPAMSQARLHQVAPVFLP